MLSTASITIERVTPKSKESVEQFLWEQCFLHYGDKIKPERYVELKARLHKECENPSNALFIALTEDKKIVGCIALSKYDHRIQTLHTYYKQDESIAEVSRCYVDENYRRQGIGAQLFEKVNLFAKEIGYEMLYLHTHHFLPGGFHFWKKMGFEIALDENDAWQTVHMDRFVNESICCA